MRAAAAADIDWVTRWRELVAARDHQSERLGLSAPAGDHWTRRAAAFARMSATTTDDDPVVDRVLSLLPSGGGTVLDVGAGAGRYAVPLAARGARVVAVEPNGAMAGHLRTAAHGRGVGVDLVEGAWPAAAAAAGDADVVLCAHVLYPIADVVPFLDALDAAARGCVVVVARLGQVDGAFAGVFRDVMGEERVPLPHLPDVWNLLLDTGRAAGVELHPITTTWAFADAAAAVEEAASRLHIAPGSPRWDAVDSAVRARLQADGDGVVLPSPPARQGVVWWRPAEPASG